MDKNYSNTPICDDPACLCSVRSCISKFRGIRKIPNNIQREIYEKFVNMNFNFSTSTQLTNIEQPSVTEIVDDKESIKNQNNIKQVEENLESSFIQKNKKQIVASPDESNHSEMSKLQDIDTFITPEVLSQMETIINDFDYKEVILDDSNNIHQPNKADLLKIETTPKHVDTSTNTIPSKLNPAYRCTICCNQISKEPQEHPIISVLLCKVCGKKVHKDKHLLRVEDSSNYCSWCFGGGELVMCDNCDISYCNKCIIRNTGMEYYIKITHKSYSWKCFSCDNTSIKHLVFNCKLAIEDSMKSFEKQLKAKINSRKRHHESLSVDNEKKAKKHLVVESSPSEVSMSPSSTSSSSSGESLNVIGNNNIQTTLSYGTLQSSSSDESSVTVPVLINTNKSKHIKEVEKCQPTFKPQNIQTVSLQDDVNGEAIVSLSPFYSERLKKHQHAGVKFMYNSVVNNITEFKTSQKDSGHGCILAHCMGLGKSLQTIALISTLFANKACKTVLILCPLNVSDHWKNEFKEWAQYDKYSIYHLLNQNVCKEEKRRITEEWYEQGGVLVVNYAYYRSLLKPRSNYSETFQLSMKHALQNPGPDIVICDEGHMIKNINTSIYKVLNLIKTKRRIVLTGTPLQNNLMEYYAMVDFTSPGLLGNIKTFRTRFSTPIQNGQVSDASQFCVSNMKRRCHVLHRLLKNVVQRMDYTHLLPYLPPKYEYTILVRPTELQTRLYIQVADSELNNHIIDGEESNYSINSLFKIFQTYILIGLHPGTLVISDIRQAKNMEDDFDMMAISDTETNAQDMDDIENVSNINAALSSSEGLNKKPQPKNQWYSTYFNVDKDLYDIKLGSKMMIFNTILEDSIKSGQKIVVFSQSLACLDILHQYLTRGILFAPNKKEKKWIANKHFFRIDGSTHLVNRSNMVSEFNNETNTNARLMLISTRAGGLGINLKGASRLVILDCSWNPSNDVQSMFRVYRFGQTKPVVIYRLVSEGVLEQRVYYRQIVKLALSGRVVDKKQVQRVFTKYELSDLFKVSPTLLSNTTPLPPPDTKRMIGMLDVVKKCYPQYIVKCLEHNSLLVDNPEQDLTEQEQNQAMEEYKNETQPKRYNLPNNESYALTSTPISKPKS